MGRHHSQRTMPLKRVSIHNCSWFTFLATFWRLKSISFRLPFSYLYLSSRASQPSWLGTSSLLSAADCNWWQKERSGLFPKVAVQFYAAMTSWWSEIDFLPSTHFCLTPYNNRPAVQHQLPGFLIVESCRPGSLQFCCWEGFSWDIPGFPLSCRGWINICCRAARRRECVSLSSRPD